MNTKSVVTPEVRFVRSIVNALSPTAENIRNEAYGVRSTSGVRAILTEILESLNSDLKPWVFEICERDREGVRMEPWTVEASIKSDQKEPE